MNRVDVLDLAIYVVLAAAVILGSAAWVISWSAKLLKLALLRRRR